MDYCTYQRMRAAKMAKLPRVKRAVEWLVEWKLEGTNGSLLPWIFEKEIYFLRKVVLVLLIRKCPGV